MARKEVIHSAWSLGFFIGGLVLTFYGGSPDPLLSAIGLATVLITIGEFWLSRRTDLWVLTLGGGVALLLAPYWLLPLLDIIIGCLRFIEGAREGLIANTDHFSGVLDAMWFKYAFTCLPLFNSFFTWVSEKFIDHMLVPISERVLDWWYSW